MAQAAEGTGRKAEEMSTTSTVLKFAAHVGEPINEDALIDSAVEDIRRARREANEAAEWFFDDIFRTILPLYADNHDNIIMIQRHFKAAGLDDMTLKLLHNSFLYASRSLESINKVRRANGTKGMTMAEWLAFEKRVYCLSYIKS